MLQALYVTVVGMGLVFLALGVLLVAMIVLGCVFRPRPLAGDEAEPSSVQDDLAEVAAIAVALARTLRGGRGAQLGSELGGRGTWGGAQPAQTWRVRR